MSISGEWTWEAMLDDFRALGGVAENIRFGNGPHGHGLFPIDPAKPVFLRLPNNLLFPVAEIEFVDERIKIKDSASVGQSERDFFEAYENAFSWGAGGRSESANFVAAFDELPTDVRALLTAEFGMREFIEGDLVERTRKRFLKSRIIDWDKTQVVMPLVEMANHDPHGLPYRADEFGRLHIQGNVSGEILVAYGSQDAFGIFRTFGFVTEQPQAYSLQMKTKTKVGDLRIHRNITDQTRRGAFLIPRLTSEGGSHVLSYLMIGNPKFPRLSRGIFQTLMKQAGVPNPNEVFDVVLRSNRAKFLKLLVALEPLGGEMAVTLRKMAHIQLERISHCIGARDL